MRKSLRLLSSLVLALVLASCTQDPNIYSHLGYDPLSDLEVEASFIEVKKGESFDVLSLAGDFKGSIQIKYKVDSDMRLLVAMDSTRLERLAQALDYMKRYSDVDAYLSRELDEGIRAACVDTKAFVYKAVADLKGQIDILVGYLGPYAETLSDEKNLIDSLLAEILSFMDPAKGTYTVQDYIAIQLSENIVAATLKCIHIILLDLPGAALEYTWSDIEKGILSLDGVEAAVRDNAAALVGIFVGALADLDLTASNIEGFLSLSTILEGLV